MYKPLHVSLARLHQCELLCLSQEEEFVSWVVLEDSRLLILAASSFFPSSVASPLKWPGGPDGVQKQAACISLCWNWQRKSDTGTNNHKSGLSWLNQAWLASKLLAACETNCDTDTLNFAVSFKHWLWWETAVRTSPPKKRKGEKGEKKKRESRLMIQNHNKVCLLYSLAQKLLYSSILL